MCGKRVKSICSFYSNPAAVIIALAVVLLVNVKFPQVEGLELNPKWFACRIEFTDQEAKIKTILDCAKKQNYKLPTEDLQEAIQKEMERLSSNDFDDSCFSKCLYENMNLIKDGKINTGEVSGYFKTSNISEPLLKEYTKLFEECVKETEPKFKDEKEIPCKMFTMIDVCSFKKFEENKKQLEEICNKGSR